MSESTADFKRVGLLGSGPVATAIAELVTASGREVIGTVTDLADADLVLEFSAGDAAGTKQLLAEIAAVVGAHIPIVTGTATLSVTELAAGVPEPERVAGLHFLDAVSGIGVAEVVRALRTADALVQALVAFAGSLEGVQPVVVDDRPGFLLNALFVPYLNDVVQEFDDGLASAEDIDVALKLGLGYRRGPLETLDRIGLDEHLRTTEALYAATRDGRYAPPPLLRRMVAAGYLGDKTGQGFRTAAAATEEE
ncbi:3-hydroxyacyl-CoA dehydrogenase family protein [Amycolatopsis granulosa]|uniref:3-hydroxyacyl-CoA dehydrogenase family protein n=1 Tax=Amycolatopsis granulosa TaxID=185684 RepID=UPI0014202FAD|nr:3-hydroxyacyl-CoA dehydrogenase family protein [Amycolatopsis granulosa]NIH83353.1 3-hydroxybutyryl-CoA dehydrogenase [Amycolatopsis granulosa]